MRCELNLLALTFIYGVRWMMVFYMGTLPFDLYGCFKKWIFGSKYSFMDVFFLVYGVDLDVVMALRLQ